MNDAKIENWHENNFISDYISMINSFRSMKSNPTVFVCIPPPFYSNVSTYGVQPHIVNTALPRIVAKLAYESGSETIDLFHALGGSLGALSKPFLYIPGSCKCLNCVLVQMLE